jgi:hypothetical protein
MIDLDATQLQIVRTILQNHFGEYEVRVFGSRIKNNAKRFSDLDLVIMSDKQIDWQKLEAAKDDFSNSNLAIIIDLHDWSALSESFKNVINRQFEVL